MNPQVSKSILLPTPKHRLAKILSLAVFGMGLMWMANVMAAPAPVAKTNGAKAQSSDDVLKWLQMTGTKSVNEGKDEKEHKATKETKEVSKASAASANNGSNASSPVQSRPAIPEKPVVRAVPEIPAPANPVPEPVMTVAVAPGSALSLPPENPSQNQTPLTPSVAPAPPEEPEVKVLSREQPVFPREAENRGHRRGRVTARLYVATDGTVSRVEIVEANPKRVFDNAVTDAAMRWKFSPLPAPNATDVTFNFKMVE